MIPFLSPPSSIVSNPIMDTFNLPGFTLGIPVWYLDPPTPHPTPHIVLTPIQPIEMESHPPPSPSKTSFIPKPSPPLPKKDLGKSTKVTTEPRPNLPCTLCDI